MRISAYQFSVSDDIDFNYRTIVKALRKARDRGDELVVFPECALTGYPPRNMASSSEVDFFKVEECCKMLQDVCDEIKVAFILGMIVKEKDKIYNRAVFFRPEEKIFTYDKRALWGWDKENFSMSEREDIKLLQKNDIGTIEETECISGKGIVEYKHIRIGIRICFEIRFPEFFRELYKGKTDLNVVLFYDVSDADNIDRYNMLKGHLQTRAVENVCTFISANTIGPYQTAPTAIIGRSGQFLAECQRNKEDFIEYELEENEYDFGEQGRKEISDNIVFRGMIDGNRESKCIDNRR